ncbi:MAG: glycosyltransferase family 39 protein [Methanobacterium sp.]
MGYSDLMRPPLLSFLTSIPFRMGYVSPTTLFALDGLLYIFGVIGLYFLLKLKFSTIQSFLGALVYATFPTVLFIMGFGFSDLASVSFTIWTFYFLILAVKRDSRFFYLAFPFAMLAFLTRYNSALIIFPICLYILINRDKIKNIKNMLGGMFTSLLLLVPVFIFYGQKFGNMVYPFMAFFGATSTSLSSESAAYNPNLFFFIEKLHLFIGIESILTVLIIAAGFFIYMILKLKREPFDKKMLFNGLNVRNRNTKLKLVLFVALALVFAFSFGHISAYYSEVLFFILAYLLYDFLKNFKIKDLDMHILFFAWFMAFFIFHSVFAIKVDRYFVLMAPPVAYFLILGLSGISNRLKFKIKNFNVIPSILAISLIILILLSTTSYLPSIIQASQKYKVTNEIIISASEWFINYDPDYKNKTICSDIWPYFGWYLKTNVRPMPEFKGDQKFYGGITDYNLTSQDNIAYNKELEINNADYYFCNRPELNLTSYKPIKQFGKLIIYKRSV